MSMRATWLVAAAIAVCAPAAAQTSLSEQSPLSDTRAFEFANALSYYGFDACGDGLGGRLYRRALAAKFAQCPFTPEARSVLANRERQQARKSRTAIEHVIDQKDGLPVQLEGMNRTCHEQAASPEYQAFNSKLQRFSAGEIPADAVFPQPCDAASFAP